MTKSKITSAEIDALKALANENIAKIYDFTRKVIDEGVDARLSFKDAAPILTFGEAISKAANALMFELEAQESRSKSDALRAQAKKA